MRLCRLLLVVLAAIGCAAPLFAQTRLYPLQARYLSVLDGETHALLGRLDLIALGNPSGIALTHNNSRAYIGLGGSSSGVLPGDPPAPGPQSKVAVVNLLTLTVIRTIDVGAQPMLVVASASGDRVYVANVGGRTISVIRTSDDTVIATIDLAGGSSGSLQLSPDASRLYVVVGSPSAGSIIAIDTASLAVTATSGPIACTNGLAVSPDGARLYASGGCIGGNTLRVYDAPTLAQTATIDIAGAGSLAFTPDGSRLVLGASSNLGRTVVLDAATLSELGSLTPSGIFVRVDPSGARAYTFGFWGNTSPNFGTYQVNSINLTTYTVEKKTNIGFLATGFAVAPVSPCGNFLATPSYSAVTLGGGTGTFTAPVPAGCAWSVESTDPWLTITSTSSGTGPATITYSVPPSSAARTGELRINGQVLPVYQTQPLVQIDSPAAGLHVVQGFQLAGWVGELAVAGPASGVLSNPLTIHVWAYPAAGGQPQLVAQTTASSSRPDVAAVFPGYQTGGFNVTVTGLAPGTYTFVVYLYSRYLNAFAAAQTVTLTVDPSLFSVIDTLQPNASVTVPFRLGGWALDASASSGTGVDVVNVYAYPDSGGSPIFAGMAVYGLTRNDLVQYFGTRFRDTGYGLAVDGLAPGGYTMVAYAHSTVTGRFEPAVVHVTVTGAAEPLEIETFGIPPHGNPRAVFATGWAIDRRASGGPGVTAIQAWAYPSSGAAPIFLGSAQMPFARADIASIYGARYRDSGWTLGGQLPSGSYQIVFYALSAATGKFDNVRVRSLIVP